MPGGGGGGGGGGGPPPPPPPRDDLRFSNTTGILLLQKKTMWFIGVEVDQETSATPPKKNPGSTPDVWHIRASHACQICLTLHAQSQVIDLF